MVKDVEVQCCWCGLTDKYKNGGFDDFRCPYCGNRTCRQRVIQDGK